eukprot:scaffold265783_cov31-Tisochrysis_lutea.AAC.1
MLRVQLRALRSRTESWRIEGQVGPCVNTRAQSADQARWQVADKPGAEGHRHRKAQMERVRVARPARMLALGPPAGFCLHEVSMWRWHSEQVDCEKK